MTCGCTGRQSTKSERYDPVKESGCCFGAGKQKKRHHKKHKCCCPNLDQGCPPIDTWYSTGVSGHTLRRVWWSTGVFSSYCEPGPYTNFQTGVTGFSGYSTQ